jgi:RecT family
MPTKNAHSVAHSRPSKPRSASSQKSRGASTRQRTSSPTSSKRKPKLPTALVVRAADRSPWLLQPEEITILKNAICKGATDDELKYCLAVARRYHLDPFQQQIWFTPRWDKQAERSDGKKGATVYVPVVGINGMLHIAARDHKDFGTFSEPEYGPMIEVQWQWNGEGAYKKLMVPEWCRIEAHKKGSALPTVAKVWWTEIYPNIDFAPLVRRMPRLMLAKCAKAQATRTSYPSTGGLLIEEETHSREFTDITPGGRIVTPALSEAEQNWQKHEAENLGRLTPEQKAVIEEKMKSANSPMGAEPHNAEAKQAHSTRADSRGSVETPTAPYILWTYHKESDTYEIEGPKELLSAHKKEVFGKLWNGAVQKLIATGEQFEDLKHELDVRKIAYKRKDS